MNKKTKDILKSVGFNEVKIPYIDTRWTKWWIKIESILTNKDSFNINRHRQRKYLFVDKERNTGAKWQQTLFHALVAKKPISEMEMNFESTLWIEDGQQRFYTIIAILTDCVKIGTGITEYGKNYEKYVGKYFSELPSSVQKNILNAPIEVRLSSKLTEEELHKRFIDINDNNSLSGQDKRSSMNNYGSNYIQNLVEDGGFDMMDIDLDPDSKTYMSHKWVNVGVKGRKLEEVVAHMFSWMYPNYTFEFNGGTLNKLYNEDFKTKKFNKELPGLSKKFEEVLRVINDSISEDDKKLLTTRVLFLIFVTVLELKERRWKIKDDVVQKILSGYSNRTRLNESVLINNRGKDVEKLFKDWISKITTVEAVSKIRDEVIKGMEIKNPEWFTKLDKKRIFDTEWKYEKFNDQKKCCGNPLCKKKMKFSDMEGDHCVAWTHGGETTFENLIMLCVECNRMKGSKKWEDFLKEYQNNGHHIFKFKKVS